MHGIGNVSLELNLTTVCLSDLCCSHLALCGSCHRPCLLGSSSWQFFLVPLWWRRLCALLPRIPKFLGLHHCSQHPGAHLSLCQVRLSSLWPSALREELGTPCQFSTFSFSNTCFKGHKEQIRKELSLQNWRWSGQRELILRVCPVLGAASCILASWQIKLLEFRGQTLLLRSLSWQDSWLGSEARAQASERAGWRFRMSWDNFVVFRFRGRPNLFSESSVLPPAAPPACKTHWASWVLPSLFSLSKCSLSHLNPNCDKRVIKEHRISDRWSSPCFLILLPFFLLF